MPIRRFLPLALALALVPAAGAQSYRGSATTAPGITSGLTFRFRSFSAGVDKLYVGDGASLGTGVRDAYNGTWNGLGSSTSLTFLMWWDAASASGAFYVSNLSNVTQSTDNAAVTSSSLTNASYYSLALGNTTTGHFFLFGGSPTFDTFRLFHRMAGATLTRLTYTADSTVTLVGPGSTLDLSNQAQYWSAQPEQSFFFEGIIAFPTAPAAAACGNDNCRFEVGFASTPVTPVPEPASPLLVAAGAGLLAVVARRRAGAA